MYSRKVISFGKIVRRWKMWWKRHRVPEAKAEILEVAEFFVSPLDHRIYACGYDEHAVDFAVILDGLLGTEEVGFAGGWEEMGLRPLSPSGPVWTPKPPALKIRGLRLHSFKKVFAGAILAGSVSQRSSV
jgi:hypothetical protein